MGLPFSVLDPFRLLVSCISVRVQKFDTILEIIQLGFNNIGKKFFDGQTGYMLFSGSSIYVIFRYHDIRYFQVAGYTLFSGSRIYVIFR